MFVETDLSGFFKDIGRSIEKTIKNPQRLIRVVTPLLPTKYQRRIEDEIKRTAERGAGVIVGGVGGKASWVGIKSESGKGKFAQGQKIGRVAMPIVLAVAGAVYFGPQLLAASKAIAAQASAAGSFTFGAAKWVGGKLLAVGPLAANILMGQGVQPDQATAEEIVAATTQAGEGDDALFAQYAQTTQATLSPTMIASIVGGVALIGIALTLGGQQKRRRR